jgi:hypothetical protein
VRLDKEVVTGQQQVEGELRKERVEVDGDADVRGDVPKRDRRS